MIARGVCHVYFAFLAAAKVDLERAQAIARRPTERTRFQRDRRTPAYIDFDPPPLQIVVPCDSVPIGSGRFATEARVDVTIFDFGAFSVDYRVPFEASLAELARLSSALYDHVGLLGAARARAAEIAEAIRPALSGERMSDVYEQYAVFDFAGFEPGLPAAELLAKDDVRQSLAQILRAEERVLSESRVGDALRLSISYSPDDLLIVDWSTALAVGGSADERLVLEFANAELLELRNLDKHLDRDLEEANRALQRRRRAIRSGAELRHVAQLQVDGAMLYESVNNAVSLLGDQWLADVYGLIAERYDLDKWHGSIGHKLEALDSIYQKIGDQASTRRSELLEIVVILLIALEVRWGSLFAGLRSWLGGGAP